MTVAPASWAPARHPRRSFLVQPPKTKSCLRAPRPATDARRLIERLSSSHHTESARRFRAGRPPHARRRGDACVKHDSRPPTPTDRPRGSSRPCCSASRFSRLPPSPRNQPRRRMPPSSPPGTSTRSPGSPPPARVPRTSSTSPSSTWRCTTPSWGSRASTSCTSGTRWGRGALRPRPQRRPPPTACSCTTSGRPPRSSPTSIRSSPRLCCSCRTARNRTRESGTESAPRTGSLRSARTTVATPQ